MSKVFAKVTHQCGATAEQMYDAWLRPEAARVWMATSLRSHGLPGEIGAVEIDARVGGRFLFTDMRPEGEARHWGTYLELERPRRIVFTWIVDESEEADPSKVTLTFEPDGDGGGGCVATLVHEMDAAWVEWVSKTEEGWQRMLVASSSASADA